MSSTQLGKWRNPPLAYVVAEVVISPHYSFPQFFPAIQQALRAQFPRTVEGSDFNIESFTPGAMPTPEPFWRLLTADSHRGVQLGKRIFSLHVTHYEDFEEFAVCLTGVLKAIEDSQLGAFVERIGLRYLDYIVPSPDHRPEDYVAEPIRGVGISGTNTPLTAMWLGIYTIPNGTVNLRVSAPAMPGQPLPPNFLFLPLTKPATMLAAEQRALSNEPFGFIDTDCVLNISISLETETLMQSFRKMHEHISASFKTALSDLARQEWE